MCVLVRARCSRGGGAKTYSIRIIIEVKLETRTKTSERERAGTRRIADGSILDAFLAKDKHTKLELGVAKR